MSKAQEVLASYPRDALGRLILPVATLERFWAKVRKDGPTQPHMETPCWVWTACKNVDGYGVFRLAGANTKAHRLAWELIEGHLGDKECCHRCDWPPCVRQDHCFKATHSGNMRDKMRKGRDTRVALNRRDILEIRRRAHAGERGSELAREYGVGDHVVSHIVIGRNARWAGGPTRLPGERPGGGKLTASEVIEIRRRARSGEVQRLIAADFGISQSTVSNIVLGKKWNKLP